MEKEEFRTMILAACDDNHKEEIEDWLIKAEQEFEHMARVTKFPIERIRASYNLFGIGLGLAQEDEPTK